MLSLQQNLLVVLGEECAEVAQRAAKALRFGMTEIQPGQALTNGERIASELCDLVAVAELLQAAGALPQFDRAAIERKKHKVAVFARYSQLCGAVDPSTLV